MGQFYGRVPRSRDVVRLVRASIAESGKSRFLITDHGTQFRRVFHEAMDRLHIHHVQGRVRAPYLNGKIERFFRTFRLWWRFVLTGPSLPSIQRRLEDHRHWYNKHRPHNSLDGLTPEDAWNDKRPRHAVSYHACEASPPHIRIRRMPCRGDPRLPMLHIQVRRAA